MGTKKWGALFFVLYFRNLYRERVQERKNTARLPFLIAILAGTWS